MTSERSLIVVHYTGTKIGDSAGNALGGVSPRSLSPFDHLGVITKNYERDNPKSRLTLTQIIEILLGDPKQHHQVFRHIPGSSKMERGEVVSLTLFVNDYESVIK
ncbi:MAG: hypothetical protein V7K21_19155 [Nostoc sp.]|uniref:hypothetical protein n=1 Tax=Nostoc sp. TaxID=1180 RepID=UPI002FF83567